MSFVSPNPETGRVFNNPDSFAMAFDTAWSKLLESKENHNKSQDEKLEMVLEQVNDHPFLQESPKQAIEVAKFRIKLLRLI